MQSHCLNQCWNIVNWTLTNKLQWNLNQNSCIFIQENAFENVVWTIVAILTRLDVSIIHCYLCFAQSNHHNAFHFLMIRHRTICLLNTVSVCTGSITWHMESWSFLFHWQLTKLKTTYLAPTWNVLNMTWGNTWYYRNVAHFKSSHLGPILLQRVNFNSSMNK